ncbi:MAG: hypothetical protein B7Z66_15435 [Chromatiales bacterium 21-64-14]|nr:MAG: hypothetical protein B7Z66_15435 [Chromatiales bacterium 21-64-14]
MTPKNAHIENVLCLAAALALLIAGSSKSVAATTTSTFNVNANVLAVCTVTSTDLNFGDYDASQASHDTATSTLSVTCSKGQDYTIALNAGAGVGATVAARKMTSGAEALHYHLYTSGAHSTIWGDGTLATAVVPGTGSGDAQSHTVYGQIPINQHVPSGVYSDTINVTFTY